VLSLLRETVTRWWRGDSLRSGAALAYYTVFSLAPVLLVAIAVAGFFFGEEAARGRVVEQLRGLLGADGATLIEQAVERAALRPDKGLGATALALGGILLGASGAFGQLQKALDEIWQGPAPGAAASAGIWRSLRERIVSFGLVLLLGFMLLVSLVLAAAVAALDAWLGRSSELLQPLLGVFQLAASFALETLLFAAIFKLLPAGGTRWRDALRGGVATALLFEIGKALIGIYLGNAAVGSMYGAAGSLAVVLIWVYYSSQIVFLGAQLTRVWAEQPRAARPGRR
jgi:membrane protein